MDYLILNIYNIKNKNETEYIIQYAILGRVRRKQNP